MQNEWRRKLRLLLLIVAICKPMWCATSRKALVIGNDKYPGNALKNARNDARGVADALNHLGYKTTLLQDVTREKLAKGIDDFAQTLEHGDVAVVYYAGHGLQVAGDNYLVPIDFRAADQAEVPYQGYPLSEVLSKLTMHGALTEIVILDSCRNNPFAATRSLAGGWAAMSTSAGTYLAFGTAPGSTASDDPNEDHGLFTKSLLQYLGSNADIDQTFGKVRQNVIQQSGGRQVPWTASSLIGTFHFVPEADASAAPLVLSRTALVGWVKKHSRHKKLEREFTNTDIDNSAVASLTPAQENERLVEARTQLRNLDFDGAIATLSPLLQVNPISSVALRLLGGLLQIVGRREEAKQTLDRAIKVDDTDAVAYSYRCLVTALDNPDSAEAFCRHALKLNNKLAEAHVGMALVLHSQGHDSDAFNEVNRAISLDPGSPVGFSLRGDLTDSQNHHSLAEQDYSRAMKLALSKAE